MKSFQLTEHDLADLEETISWLAAESEEAALNLVNDLEAAFRFLAQWPGSGHLRSDLFPLPLRFWNASGYLIVYEPRTRPITIVAVLHGSRDAVSLLRKRHLAP